MLASVALVQHYDIYKPVIPIDASAVNDEPWQYEGTIIIGLGDFC